MSRVGRSFPNRVKFGRPILSQATVRSRTQGAQVTDSLTHVINVPEHAVGDLLYVAFSIDTGTTVTSTSSTGWQKLIEMAQGSSTNQTGSVWWKRATGSDALTINSSTAEQSTHISLAVANADDPEAVAANGASAAAAVPPAISATKGTEDYLCLVSTHTDTSAGTTQNFGLISTFEISTTQQGSTTASAATNVQEEVFLRNSGSIAPGTVSLSLAEQWVSITTVIGSQGQTSSVVTIQGSVTLTATPTLTVSGTVYKPPGSFFNLNNWKITVPYDGPDGDVNADEITQPTLNTYVDTQYFYLDASNQMVMDAPVNGDTTSGSAGVRTELREMDGAVESAWDKTTASRQLTVAGYFDPTNITGGSAPKKVMIVGQIHETGGTPGIYLTVDYDAVPSRLRLFKDGPGVGNLVTGFTPTDKLAFRIECTAGNVNIYGSIGDETTLPASPQFTFPASGFVEPTGSYLKTGSYNKTDTATGSTGDSIAKITYLNLNQALAVVWPATLALTATPTLTVNAVRATPATVSLTATPTISVSAVRTTPATISLTATPTLAVNAYLTEVASLSLIGTPSLTANLVRTTPASISLTATPTLSVATPALTTWATLTLTVLPVLTVNGIRTAVSAVSLTATPTLVISPQLVEVASVSLIASPTFTADATITASTQQASLSLMITPTITLSGLRVAVSSVTLTINPALTISPTQQAAATVNLTVAPSITVSAVRITPSAVNLTVLPQLTVAALLPGASVSLIATPTISATLYAIRSATVTLTVSPTLSATVGAVPATISLTASPTLSISIYVATQAALNLFISPTISLSAVRIVPATLSLLASPTLNIASLQVFAASISLSIAPSISLSGVKERPASLTLTITPTLSASAAPSGASTALLITPTINISLRYIGAASVQLTASPSLTVSATLGARATLALTVIPTLSVSFFGEVSASLLLTVVPTFAVDAIRYVPASISLTVVPSLTVNGVRLSFPSLDLLIIPSISIDLSRYAISSVSLLIIPTLFAKAFIEGAGPGWPIIFDLVSVTTGDEPVSSSQTQFKPSFDLQSKTNESGGSSVVTPPYIDFKEINA